MISKLIGKLKLYVVYKVLSKELLARKYLKQCEALSFFLCINITLNLYISDEETVLT